MAIVTSLLLLLLLVGGGVALQIFLSTRQNKWLGLILPAITFGYSLLMLLSIMVVPSMSVGELVLLLATTFILGNIPTMVLGGIYLGCSQKRKARAQLDKMNIQDLG